ncbi:pentatricopeptide repeat-containing protein At1g76280 isoform X2 [Diospyros lotus]|uniref:pentatricopeptide repeat-containing protein At1g76280 isoform X2 n=1 Tax=Diospyros lotus TaxID=55363 RepID=UPI002256522A|nr:pentatricopeptide repeat-containing protein At1g76280 isoform X2 [Diospyros lotus]
MRRLTVPLRSIAPLSYWKLKGFGGRLEKVQNFTALSGHSSLGPGTEPILRTLQVQTVNALRFGERSRASSLLLDVGNGNHPLTANDFVHILEYCARSPDPLFVLETWRIMGEKDVYVDNKSYLLILQALCKGGYLEEAFNLMNVLGESHDFYPVLSMYNDLLGGCARIQSVNHANKCLDLMERQMVGKNEITYAQLLKLAVLQQDFSAVHEIWKEYIKHYSPSIISLRKFVWAFTMLGNLEDAYTLLQYMVALALRGGFVISRTAEGKFFTSRLDIPIPLSYELVLKRSNKESEDYDYSGFVNFKTMETCVNDDQHGTDFCTEKKEVENAGLLKLQKHSGKSCMKVLRWSFNDLIHSCAKSLNYRLAEQLILQMQNLGLEPSRSTYDGFVRAVISERGYHGAIEVLKAMQQKNLKPYDSTLATIAISCSKGLELDLAESLLVQISKSLYVHPYNAFLEACDTMDQPERAVCMFAKMKEMRLQPDIRTYELLLSLFGNVNAPYEEGNMLSQVDVAKRINAIEIDMVKNGIQHSHLSMKNLLKALGGEGMVKELIQYLHVVENQFSRGYFCLGTPAYNTVLHSLVEAKESHMAIEIFKSMMSYGFLPDAATYNIMIDCCSVIRCFKSACALVSMMVRNGFYPQTITYATLIKILLGNGDLDGALYLLDQGSLEGIQSDVLLFNTILQGACEKGRIDVIENIVRRMHQEKVQPDATTCYYVFFAYVDHDYISTAVEALQVLCMWMLSEEDSMLEEQRRELEENFILAEDLEAESRIVELFKDSKENLAAALLNLRWCATLGFPISWLPDQSPWMRRISSDSGPREGIA